VFIFCVFYDECSPCLAYYKSMYEAERAAKLRVNSGKVNNITVFLELKKLGLP
jgi:uncharacterized glyoxalase superfamily protein PhnB